MVILYVGAALLTKKRMVSPRLTLVAEAYPSTVGVSDSAVSPQSASPGLAFSCWMTFCAHAPVVLRTSQNAPTRSLTMPLPTAVSLLLHTSDDAAEKHCGMHQ